MYTIPANFILVEAKCNCKLDVLMKGGINMCKQIFACDGLKENHCSRKICEETEETGHSDFDWEDEMKDHGIVISMIDSLLGVGVSFFFFGLLLGSVPILLMAVFLTLVLPFLKDAISIFKQ